MAKHLSNLLQKRDLTRWALAPIVITAACGHAQQSPSNHDQPSHGGSSKHSDASKSEATTPPGVSATAGPGVSRLNAICGANAPERCNAVDDDCDGVIDEGCGYSSGGVQITLTWNTEADIDLYVTDPAGETIHYRKPRTASGGRMDRDARGACEETPKTSRVENVYWSATDPPRGDYHIDLHYWAGSSCSAEAGPTTTTSSISVRGATLGTYNYTVEPDQKIRVLSFTVR